MDRRNDDSAAGVASNAGYNVIGTIVTERHIKTLGVVAQTNDLKAAACIPAGCFFYVFPLGGCSVIHKQLQAGAAFKSTASDCTDGYRKIDHSQIRISVKCSAVNFGNRQAMIVFRNNDLRIRTAADAVKRRVFGSVINGLIQSFGKLSQTIDLYGTVAGPIKTFFNKIPLAFGAVKEDGYSA